MQNFPHHIKQGGKYIYVMYVYDCNFILTTSIKNRSDKDMIRAFTSLTEYLQGLGINPCFHIMDNEESTTLKLAITIMNIK